MNDKEFWDLIAWVNAQSDHPDEHQDAIEDALAELPPEQIEDFYLIYDRFVTAAWTHDVALLTYLINCYGTRSGYEYLLGFICWLVDQGPVVYHAALTDPERLADVEDDLPWESEGYWRNACFAWQIATERTDERAFHDRVGERGASGPQEYPACGGVVDDEDLRRRWPKLCKRFIERPYEEDL